MGNGVSTDQGNLPSYGKRDVSDAADTEQHDWSQLAVAPITEQPSFALSSPRNSYSGASNVGPRSSKDDTTKDVCDTYSVARLQDLESEDDTQSDIFNDALSSVMEDDSGYNTRISTWESAESANNNQLRQRRRQSASSSAEDGEVRAEVNRRREGRKKSTTSTETALPKSTNTHADASACTAAQYAEEKKSTYTCDDASARPTLGRVAAHHTGERTTMKRPASLQLIPTRDIQLPTDKVLPPSTSRSPESSTMGFHARELAELQQRPETVEDQPRRVSAEVR